MVFDTVCAVLADILAVNADDITLDTDILQDLNADSLDVLDIITALEDESDIEVPDDKIEDLTTVGAVVDYVKDVTGKE